MVEVVEELPPRLEGAVKHWLKVNQREAVEVKHSVFPLGMVQRWVERGEEAETAAREQRGIADDLIRQNKRLYSLLREHLGSREIDVRMLGWADEEATS